MSFYKMERGWMDSEVFEDAPYTEREAWEWMIGEANWKDGLINVDGKPYSLKRGQLRTSIRFMAKKFQWGSNRVQRFLKKLKNWQMADTQTDTGQTVVTICNYSKYQDDKRGADTQPDTPVDTAAAHQRIQTIKELQEGKEGEEESGLFSEKELRQFRKQCPSLSETEFKNQVTNCEIWITANGSRTPELTLSKWLQREESEKQKKKPASNGLQAFQEIMEQAI